MTDIWAAADKSVRWAQKAVDELEAEFRTIGESKPYAIVVDFDPKTEEHIAKVKLIKPLPEDIDRRACEALVTAKHGFDQAIFAAAKTLGWTGGRDLHFPWATTKADMEGKLRRKNVPQELWNIIGDHKPYPTAERPAAPTNLIRTLAQIANDKHTVGIGVHGYVMEVEAPATLHSGRKFTSTSNYRWDTVKNEAELYRWIGDATLHPNSKLRVYIVLTHSRLPFPVEAISTLRLFATKAQNVLEDLKNVVSVVRTLRERGH